MAMFININIHFITFLVELSFRREARFLQAPPESLCVLWGLPLTLWASVISTVTCLWQLSRYQFLLLEFDCVQSSCRCGSCPTIFLSFLIVWIEVLENSTLEETSYYCRQIQMSVIKTKLVPMSSIAVLGSEPPDSSLPTCTVQILIYICQVLVTTVYCMWVPHITHTEALEPSKW